MKRRTLLELAVPTLLGGLRPAWGQTSSSGTQLVLLGTQGGPNFTAARAESSSALIVDGRVYLIDCGYGALAALVKAGLRYAEVDDIFLTHLHDDHAADLPSLLGHQWTYGRVTPVGVYGPAGTARLVAAAVAYNEVNEEIRYVDENRSVRLRDLVAGHDIEASAKPVRAFEDDRLAVYAVESTHYPPESKAQMPHRALSYRCESRDRRVVFSGDTAVSPALVELARGADVLVCEAMDLALTRRSFEARVARGAYADNSEGVWHHIVTTHTTTEQAGEMAAAAGVRTLVLNHLLPGALSAEVPDETYAAAARKHFDGEVVVGRDSLVL
jgi:ribonuclease BN (tRNA processing enzyme)